MEKSNKLTEDLTSFLTYEGNGWVEHVGHKIGVSKMYEAHFSRRLADAEIQWLFNEGKGRAYSELGSIPDLLGALTLWSDINDVSGEAYAAFTLPDELDYGTVADAMISHGGSFMQNIGRALACADSNNRKRLVQTFHSDFIYYWNTYGPQAEKPGTS